MKPSANLPGPARWADNLRAVLDQADSVKLSMTDLRVTLTIYYHGTILQSEISTELKSSRQTINASTKKLVKMGLINARRDPENGRIVHLSLSKTGSLYVENIKGYLDHGRQQATA